MATFKIKKGDTVKVIAGKDNGKEGKVLSVDAKNNKVVVEGVNVKGNDDEPRRFVLFEIGKNAGKRVVDGAGRAVIEQCFDKILHHG